MNESSKANGHGTPDSSGTADPKVTEPELETAKISEEVAESVDLKAAEAEAAAVEHEAELAALASSPEPAKPDAGAAATSPVTSPEVPPTEAAEEAAKEVSAVEPPHKKAPGHIGPGIDDGHGWRRPEEAWKPKADSWQSPAQISRKAEESAAAGDVVPTPIPKAPAAPERVNPEPPSTPQTSEGNPKKILIVAGLVLVGLALLVFFILLLVGLFTGDQGKNGAQADGAATSLTEEGAASQVGDVVVADDPDLIVADVSPLNWIEGDCLRGFKDTSTPADVVLCSSPHNAQLVGTFHYEADDIFPGAVELKVKATQVCKAVEFTSDASGLTSLKQTTAYPSESTWKELDDRRVDCVVHDTRAGNPLTASLTL